MSFLLQYSWVLMGLFPLVTLVALVVIAVVIFKKSCRAKSAKRQSKQDFSSFPSSGDPWFHKKTGIDKSVRSRYHTGNSAENATTENPDNEIIVLKTPISMALRARVNYW